MDEAYLVNAVRYVMLNPVRARLVEQAGDWPWSGARAHLSGEGDGVVKVALVLERVGDFDLPAACGPPRRAESKVQRGLVNRHRNSGTGRTCGSDCRWCRR